VDGVEHDLRSADVRAQRTEGLIDDELHADGGREVDDDLTFGNELVDEELVQDAPEDELEVRMVVEAVEVA
jgi:hypothetical protein